MARGPRVDAPGAVQHVMIRGIERRRIFVDSADYDAFAARLDRLLPELGFRCFAWVLMPNHGHFVLQTGEVPLPQLMARLGTSYARYFNDRHDRAGHVTQNRYRSRLAEDEADLKGLIAYVDRNPIGAGLVPDVDALGDFESCGYAACIGTRPPRPFESPSETLRLFGDDTQAAREQLRRWVEHPLDTGAPLPAEAAEEDPTLLDRLIEVVCAGHDLPRERVLGPRHDRRTVAARAEIVRRAVEDLGLRGSVVARALGVSESTVSRALRRGRPPP